MGIDIAYRLLLLANKRYIKRTYGSSYYKKFKLAADEKLKKFKPKIPDIGKSIFSINYNFIMAYIPFSYAFNRFEETREKSGELIWAINENLFKMIPKIFWTKMGEKAASSRYLEKLRKEEKRGKDGLLHPMDWRIEVIENYDGSYYCNIKECGALKVLKQLGEDHVFPYACRLDYLMSNLDGNKFHRTKTLADGDECCNNHIIGRGYTEWSPDKGFKLRK